MKTFRRCLKSARILLPMLLANAAWAQTHELWVNVGGSVLESKQIGSPAADGAPDDLSLANNGYRFGFRFDFGAAGHFGHEIQYGYSKTNLKDTTGVFLAETTSAKMAIHQWGYNLMYYFDAVGKEARIRPFVTAGFHVSDFVLPGNAAYQGGTFKPGVNYGGGVKMRLTTAFAARLEFRQYECGKPNWQGLLFLQKGLTHQTEVSAGLGFSF